MYLGVTYNSRMTWSYHIERTVAKALGMYVRTCSLFRTGLLNTNIKLTLCKALVRSVMIHAYSTCEYVVDDPLLKPQRLQNRIFCAIGNLDRCTPVHELHMAFKIPYVFDYITKLWKHVVQ
jgi:hypothetical protein